MTVFSGDVSNLSFQKKYAFRAVSKTWYRVWGDENLFAVPQIEKLGGQRETHCILELNVG